METRTPPKRERNSKKGRVIWKRECGEGSFINKCFISALGSMMRNDGEGKSKSKNEETYGCDVNPSEDCFRVSNYSSYSHGCGGYSQCVDRDDESDYYDVDNGSWRCEAASCRDSALNALCDKDICDKSKPLYFYSARRYNEIIPRGDGISQNECEFCSLNLVTYHGSNLITKDLSRREALKKSASRDSVIVCFHCGNYCAVHPKNFLKEYKKCEYCRCQCSHIAERNNTVQRNAADCGLLNEKVDNCNCCATENIYVTWPPKLPQNSCCNNSGDINSVLCGAEVDTVSYSKDDDAINTENSESYQRNTCQSKFDNNFVKLIRKIRQRFNLRRNTNKKQSNFHRNVFGLKTQNTKSPIEYNNWKYKIRKPLNEKDCSKIKTDLQSTHSRTHPSILETRSVKLVKSTARINKSLSPRRCLPLPRDKVKRAITPWSIPSFLPDKCFLLYGHSSNNQSANPSTPSPVVTSQPWDMTSPHPLQPLSSAWSGTMGSTNPGKTGLSNTNTLSIGDRTPDNTDHRSSVSSGNSSCSSPSQNANCTRASEKAEGNNDEEVAASRDGEDKVISHINENKEREGPMVGLIEKDKVTGAYVENLSQKILAIEEEEEEESGTGSRVVDTETSCLVDACVDINKGGQEESNNGKGCRDTQVSVGESGFPSSDVDGVCCDKSENTCVVDNLPVEETINSEDENKKELFRDGKENVVINENVQHNGTNSFSIENKDLQVKVENGEVVKECESNNVRDEVITRNRKSRDCELKGIDNDCNKVNKDLDSGNNDRKELTTDKCEIHTGAECTIQDSRATGITSFPADHAKEEIKNFCACEVNHNIGYPLRVDRMREKHRDQRVSMVYMNSDFCRDSTLCFDPQYCSEINDNVNNNYSLSSSSFPSPCLKENQQIVLGINPEIVHSRRLSHQYINSYLTGHTYPDFIPQSASMNFTSTLSATTDPNCLEKPAAVQDFQKLSPNSPLRQNDSCVLLSSPKRSNYINNNFCNSSGSTTTISTSSHHYYNCNNGCLTPVIPSINIPPGNAMRPDSTTKRPVGNFTPHREQCCDVNMFSTMLKPGLNNTVQKPLAVRPFPPSSKSPLFQHNPSFKLGPYYNQNHTFCEQCHRLAQSPEQDPHQQNRLPYQHHHFYHLQQNKQQLSGNGTSSFAANHFDPWMPNISVACFKHIFHLSPVSLLWTLLSVLISASCLVSFLTPYWMTHPDHAHSFGLINLCVADPNYARTRPLCVRYGEQFFRYTYSYGDNNNYNDNNSKRNKIVNENLTFRLVPETRGSALFNQIPSEAWQAASILFGSGCCVQILGAAVSMVTLALWEPWRRKLTVLNGYMQSSAVFLLFLGLLVYPAGFDCPLYTYYCHSSSQSYSSGQCSMGWSYITAIMTTALSVFCPVLAWLAPHGQNISPKDPAFVT